MTSHPHQPHLWEVARLRCNMETVRRDIWKKGTYATIIGQWDDLYWLKDSRGRRIHEVPAKAIEVILPPELT